MGIGMTNPTNSESEIHYGATKILIQKTNIQLYRSLMNLVYEHITYDINLNVGNNTYSYHIINSNSLLLVLIVFIGINQYLLNKFDEMYCQLFDSLILNNQYYYMETCYILYTNNNLVLNKYGNVTYR